MFTVCSQSFSDIQQKINSKRNMFVVLNSCFLVVIWIC